mmetsp:Transcript_5667/g.9614  ORF Transcript_5667/g.9614 Transcript_5667/m.9614 type:complete len:209 (-) Transcript_5667:257-883(-)
MCMHQIVVAKRIISIHWHQQNWKNQSIHQDYYSCTRKSRYHRYRLRQQRIAHTTLLSPQNPYIDQQRHRHCHPTRNCRQTTPLRRLRLAGHHTPTNNTRQRSTASCRRCSSRTLADCWCGWRPTRQTASMWLPLGRLSSSQIQRGSPVCTSLATTPVASVRDLVQMIHQTFCTRIDQWNLLVIFHSNAMPMNPIENQNQATHPKTLFL